MPQLFRIPEFRPHPLFRGGHAQTLAGYYLPAEKIVERAAKHRLTLDDGDAIILHDDCPPTWSPSGYVAVLLPGLAGSHRSGYMQRIARKLNDRGIRTFRVDHRGGGAGLGLAQHPYHAGRSDDAFAALNFVVGLCPHARHSLVGFSLSGNITLKLLGERAADLPRQLHRAIVFNPPVDLPKCADWIERRFSRAYNRYLVKHLYRQVASGPQLRADIPLARLGRCPRTLREFDNLYTAPVAGFGTSDVYYEMVSARRFISEIRIPTLVITSDDDPMIPGAPFRELTLSSAVQLHIAPSGGHLGYIARRGADPDRRWMDWRIVDWLTMALD